MFPKDAEWKREHRAARIAGAGERGFGAAAWRGAMLRVRRLRLPHFRPYALAAAALPPCKPLRPATLPAASLGMASQ